MAERDDLAVEFSQKENTENRTTPGDVPIQDIDVDSSRTELSQSMYAAGDSVKSKDPKEEDFENEKGICSESKIADFESVQTPMEHHQRLKRTSDDLLSLGGSETHEESSKDSEQSGISSLESKLLGESSAGSAESELPDDLEQPESSTKDDEFIVSCSNVDLPKSKPSVEIESDPSSLLFCERDKHVTESSFSESVSSKDPSSAFQMQMELHVHLRRALTAAGLWKSDPVNPFVDEFGSTSACSEKFHEPQESAILCDESLSASETQSSSEALQDQWLKEPITEVKIAETTGVVCDISSQIEDPLDISVEKIVKCQKDEDIDSVIGSSKSESEEGVRDRSPFSSTLSNLGCSESSSVSLSEEVSHSDDNDGQKNTQTSNPIQVCGAESLTKEKEIASKDAHPTIRQDFSGFAIDRSSLCTASAAEGNETVSGHLSFASVLSNTVPLQCGDSPGSEFKNTGYLTVQEISPKDISDPASSLGTSSAAPKFSGKTSPARPIEKPSGSPPRKHVKTTVELSGGENKEQSLASAVPSAGEKHSLPITLKSVRNQEQYPPPIQPGSSDLLPEARPSDALNTVDTSQKTSSDADSTSHQDYFDEPETTHKDEYGDIQKTILYSLLVRKPNQPYPAGAVYGNRAEVMTPNSTSLSGTKSSPLKLPPLAILPGEPSTSAHIPVTFSPPRESTNIQPDSGDGRAEDASSPDVLMPSPDENTPQDVSTSETGEANLMSVQEDEQADQMLVTENEQMNMVLVPKTEKDEPTNLISDLNTEENEQEKVMLVPKTEQGDVMAAVPRAEEAELTHPMTVPEIRLIDDDSMPATPSPVDMPSFHSSDRLQGSDIEHARDGEGLASPETKRYVPKILRSPSWYQKSKVKPVVEEASSSDISLEGRTREKVTGTLTRVPEMRGLRLVDWAQRIMRRVVNDIARDMGDVVGPPHLPIPRPTPLSVANEAVGPRRRIQALMSQIVSGNPDLQHLHAPVPMPTYSEETRQFFLDYRNVLLFMTFNVFLRSCCIRRASDYDHLFRFVFQFEMLDDYCREYGEAVLTNRSVSDEIRHLLKRFESHAGELRRALAYLLYHILCNEDEGAKERISRMFHQQLGDKWDLYLEYINTDIEPSDLE